MAEYKRPMVEAITISRAIKLLESIQRDCGDIALVSTEAPEGLPHDQMMFSGVINIVLSEDPRQKEPGYNNPDFANIAVVVMKPNNGFKTGKLHGMTTSKPQ